LLVGENSAGKSTFLAGLRYMLDFTGRSTDPTFNKDPFYLGGYKSIAHYRGGSYGRADDFWIGISEIVTGLRPLRSRVTTSLSSRRSSQVNFALRFSDVDGDAKPIEYIISIPDRSVRIFLEDEKLIALVTDERRNLEYKITRPAPSIFTSRFDFLTVEFMLRELSLVRTASPEKSKRELVAGAIVEEIWSAFRRLGAKRPQVYAFAPVRTRPLRSYDPTQLSQSSEGDEFIAKLGRMARVDAHSWTRVKSELEEYGASTGLFDEIKIQKLGRGDSDPFQILVKTSGREANIIDVGYGVSQILPFFIMLSESNQQSILLMQQPEVHLHPSAQAAVGTVIAEAASRSENPTFVVETHSDFIVDRIRMAVRDKVLRPSDVAILFFEKKKFNSHIYDIEINEEGEMLNAPDSYRRFFLKENMAIMGF
jgi:hypothetical protein